MIKQNVTVALSALCVAFALSVVGTLVVAKAEESLDESVIADSAYEIENLRESVVADIPNNTYESADNSAMQEIIDEIPLPDGESTSQGTATHREVGPGAVDLELPNIEESSITAKSRVHPITGEVIYSDYRLS